MNIQPENYLILIVDDTETNVRLLSHVLSKEGYKLSKAYNGEDAIKIAREEFPDLILLDVMMPEMSGFEVSSILSSDPAMSDIPIIFLSALSEANVKVKGFQSGGVDYITKPFQKEETLARIKTHIQIRALQKKLNERIRVLKDRETELSRLNKQKDDLVRMVSHDIKNPLMGMIGLVKILKGEDEIEAEEQAHMLEVIEDSGNKLLKLVKEVLDREAKKGSPENLEAEETDLLNLADQVIQLNKAKAIVKSISLDKNTDLGKIKAQIDPNKIETVLNNLVANALKFTPSGGSVTIGIAKPADDKVLFTVEDTGIGIPEKMVDKLFSPSERASTFGTSGEIGIGLGLDIVQHYVEMHNGTIRVESSLEQGTTFFVELPINSQ